jgi:hypothetical protein
MTIPYSIYYTILNAKQLAHSRNKYSAEASSPSVKLRALDNCFLSVVFDTQRTLLKQNKKALYQVLFDTR